MIAHNLYALGLCVLRNERKTGNNHVVHALGDNFVVLNNIWVYNIIILLMQHLSSYIYIYVNNIMIYK